MTTPIDEIHPEIDPKLEKVLDEYYNDLNELVNFGTHLLLWDVQHKREGIDNYVPSVIFRNILELLDSISILTKHSSIDPANILLRSLIENCFGLLYMLETDNKRREISFLITKTVKDINYFRNYISSEKACKTFFTHIKNDSTNLKLEHLIDNPDYVSAFKTKTDFLRNGTYKEYKIEYDRTCKKLNTKSPNWYSLFNGPRNFYYLTIHLKKVLTYEFYFRRLSENVHGTSVLKGIHLTDNNESHVIQIRDFENCHDVYSSSIIFFLQTIEEFVKKRIPHKLDDLNTWNQRVGLKILKGTAIKKINYKK